jgi:signal transduction histidine kinase
MADRDPEGAAREAAARIEALRDHAAPLLEAELYAVISLARFHQSRVAATQAAAAQAEALLDTLPPSPEADRIRARVRINVADTSESTDAFESAVRTMNDLTAKTDPRSAEHSCALSIRGQARSELGETALAAGDAFEAYRIAEIGQWPEARVVAAYVLATIYRRSGLLAEAERMIDEVVAFATADRRTPLLSTASYVRGQILVDMRRYGEARAALELSRNTAVRIGDRLGAVTADVPLCLALISEGDYTGAERVCNGSDQEFRDVGAADFLALLISYRARIDIARGQPAAAIAKLDSILTPSGVGRLVRIRSQALRDRSKAYHSLGRFREAYADLQESLDLERRANTEQQGLSVAVLSATAASEKLLASNRMLAERMGRQQEEIAHHKATQELWFVLTVAAALLSILFGYLLAVTRRHERNVARQEAIMRTMAANAPDALMLINMDRKVEFSNRQLLGPGPAPDPGTPLSDAVPPEVRGSIDDAVARLIKTREPLSFPVSVVGASNELRHFELRAAPISGSGNLLGLTLRATDVTEFRRLESEVIDVASRERQRLSSDLHEGLGQELTGISLLLTCLATSLERGADDLPDLVSEVRSHVDRCIDMTRELARGLSPVQIERGSLGNALGRLAADASRRLRLCISASSVPEDVIVSDVASDHLYRIAYEALTNASRHSVCANVVIELWVDGATLNLAVKDDGAGVRDRSAESPGLGIEMMRYRARLLGGSLQFGPRAGGGAQLLVSVPLAAVSLPLPTCEEEEDDPREDDGG